MIILISNYLPDRQTSMERFSELLAAELRGRAESIQMLRPPVVAGRQGGKWRGYVDKFVLGAATLRHRVRRIVRARDNTPTVVHICDHSNAVYAPFLELAGVVLTATCHDLLAVRGALGEDTGCPATGLGRLLQKKVLAGLRRAAHVFCDSEATRQDLQRLAPQDAARSSVVPLSLPAVFRPPSDEDVLRILEDLDLGGERCRYLLHVGSGQPRKNRAAILRLLAGPGTAGYSALFAGEALRPAECRVAKECGVESRVRMLTGLTDEQLCALYAGAMALVYPSLHEGFGWPVAEAQACGCPVICTDRSSPPEVGGQACIYVRPDDLTAMEGAVRALEDPVFRGRVIRDGLDNAKRFQQQAMSAAYLDVWRALTAES